VLIGAIARRLLPVAWRDPLAFGVVGTIGFVVDAGVLTLLFHGLGMATTTLA
jgi:hypothetical protein